LSFDSSLLHVNSVTEGDIFDDYVTFFNSGTFTSNCGSGVGYPTTYTPLDYDFIKAELNEGRPITLNVPGHYITAVGWSEDLSGPYYSPQIIIYTTWTHCI